jgi:hypothetical protein
MIKRMDSVPEGGRWSGGDEHFSQSYGRLHRRGFARTITSYFANPGIQGIEDSFRFDIFPSKAAELVGNALDLAIAQVAYRAIRQSLE